MHSLMESEWDPAMARLNLRKHGVRFADAVLALEDDTVLSIRDDRHAEDRCTSIGMDPLGRIPVVVFTWRGELIRLISALLATRREAQQYEAGI